MAHLLQCVYINCNVLWVVIDHLSLEWDAADVILCVRVCFCVCVHMLAHSIKKKKKMVEKALVISVFYFSDVCV